MTTIHRLSAVLADLWKASPSLADRTQGHDNNITLIRFLAAVMVIVGHSYHLSGNSRFEPLNLLIGRDPGQLAVDIFFVVSGLLVAKSYISRKNARSYVTARVLRIFPGLFVAVLFNVFVIGVIFTTVPIRMYVADPAVLRYILFDSTLIMRLVQLEYGLPGVFTSNPFTAAVNGSLWTLPYEVWMYILLLIMGVAGLLRSRFVVFMALVAFVAAGVIGASISPQVSGVGYLVNFGRFGSYFFLGVCAYVFRQRIRLSLPVAAGLILVAAAFWQTAVSRHVLFPLALAYTVLWLSFVPAGFIRKFNRLGDYSYGLYIYAFPVQQSIVALFPGVSPPHVLLLALPVTLVLAIISWHLVEKPAMALKRHSGVEPAAVSVNTAST